MSEFEDWCQKSNRKIPGSGDIYGIRKKISRVKYTKPVEC